MTLLRSGTMRSLTLSADDITGKEISSACAYFSKCGIGLLGSRHSLKLKLLPGRVNVPVRHPESSGDQHSWSCNTYPYKHVGQSTHLDGLQGGLPMH